MWGMASNLPPGCSISDIPGNRPDELAEEARWDDVYAKHPWLAKLCDGEPHGMTDDELHDAIVAVADYTFRQGMKVGEMNAADVAADKDAATAFERLEGLDV